MPQTIVVRIYASADHAGAPGVDGWHYASAPVSYNNGEYHAIVDGLKAAVAQYEPYIVYAGPVTYVVPPQVLATAFIEVAVEGEAE